MKKIEIKKGMKFLSGGLLRGMRIVINDKPVDRRKHFVINDGDVLFFPGHNGPVGAFMSGWHGTNVKALVISPEHCSSANFGGAICTLELISSDAPLVVNADLIED